MNKSEILDKYQTSAVLSENICFGKWNNYKNNYIISHKNKSINPKKQKLDWLTTFSEHKLIKPEINNKFLNKNKSHLGKKIIFLYKYWSEKEIQMSISDYSENKDNINIILSKLRCDKTYMQKKM